MKKKGYPWVVFFLVFALLVTACGGSGNNDGSSGGGSGNSGADSQASDPGSPGGSSSGGSSSGGEKITLRVGTWEGGDGLALQQKIAENYMNEHPNVTIEIEAVPDQYGTKILTQIASGEAPDIFQIGDGDVRMFMEKGALLDLTAFIEGENGIDLNDYYTSVLDVGKVDGKYYTMPKDYSNLAVYYNKKLFDEAGVPYPQNGWTWEDFRETAVKLTKKDGDRITQWGANLPGTWQRAILPLIHSYGGSVISPDGESFEGYLNSDGTVKALEFYRDMYFKDKLAPSTVDAEAYQGVDLFQAGITAMTITGRWPVMNYKADPNLDFGVVQMPVGPEGPANTLCYAGFGIYSKTKHPEAAWDYLKYLTGEPGQTLMAEYAFTAVIPVAEKLGQANDEHLKPFLDDLQYVKEFPEKTSHLFGKSGGPAWGTVMEKMMLESGNIDIKAELDAAAAEAEKLLAQAKAEEQ